jgi:hypothetical protein
MKALLLALCCVSSTIIAAERLAVGANLTLLGAEGYASKPQKPPCGETTSSGEIILCNGAWTRYRLSEVPDLAGTQLPDLVVLIYADPAQGGHRLLELVRLNPKEASLYGAAYLVEKM